MVTQAESGETLTYAELDGLTNRLANGLDRHGIDRDNYFAIMLSNSIAFLAASYALQKLGASQLSSEEADIRPMPGGGVSGPKGTVPVAREPKAFRNRD